MTPDNNEPTSDGVSNVANNTEVSGMNVSSSENPKPPTETPVSPLASPKPPKTNKLNPKKLLWVLIALFLIAVGVVAYRQYWPKTSIKTEDKKQFVEIDHLNVGIVEGPADSIFPKIGSGSYEHALNRQYFEGLVSYENYQIKPLLAKSWSNPDDNTWIFELQPNVLFHTGRALTANDVVLSYQAVRDNKDYSAYTATIKSVEVVDESHVKITTNGPDPTLLNRLAFLYIYDSKSGDEPSPVAGTGPFTIKPDTKPTKEKIQLVAFDKWHGGKSTLQSFDVMVFDDYEKLLQALSEKIIQVSGQIIGKRDSLKDSGLTTVDINGLNINHLAINSRKANSPLANAKVRQAIYLTLDPSQILKVRKSDGKLAGQIVPDLIPGFNPAIKRPTKDTAKAKELLTEAGYPTGFSMTLTHYSPPSDAVAAEIARQLSEINVKVVADPQTNVQALGKKAFGGETDSYYASRSTDILDASDVFEVLFHDTANYSNSKVNELLDKATVTIDAKQRLSLLQQISSTLMEDVAWIPLFAPVDYQAMDKSYQYDFTNPGSVLDINFATIKAPK